MATESDRFKWPIPDWNADWQKWQETFQDLIRNIDSNSFATMSNLTLIMKQLPTVSITGGGSSWNMIMAGDAIFVSRTHLSEIRVAATSVPLTVGAVLALTLTPGAVGPQNVEWEVYDYGLENAPEVLPLGYVDSSYNIIWFNGAVLTAGGASQRLFEFPSGSGVGGDTVKVSALDAVAGYLLAKLVAGSGITLTQLNPGANEQIRVSRSDAPLSGSGNPNGGVTGSLGQLYYDSSNQVWYRNDDGVTTWSVA